MKSRISPTQQQLNALLKHYQKQQYDKTEKLSKQLIKRFPEHQFSWKVLGALYVQLGRKYEAVSANQNAVRLGPNDAEAHNNLGNSLLATERLDEAEASYRKAITLKASFAEAHNNLGNTLKHKGLLNESEVSLRQAIALNSKSARAHNNLGVTLKEMGRLNEAEMSYRKAISLQANYTNAHRNLGNLLKELKKYKEAVFHFDLVKDITTTSLSLECLYMNENYSDFDKRLKNIAVMDDANIRVSAVSAFVAHQLKKEDPYRFCPNPLNFILIKNLKEFENEPDNLIDAIVKESDEYKLVWESRTTKFGFQGPNDLFENSSKIISNLEAIIKRVVSSYNLEFYSDPCIFIQSWPKTYKLQGWYNRLLKNGYQTAHIHPTGWLSGVIYLKTVQRTCDDEGAIEFSLHGYDLPIIRDNVPRKLHMPKNGDIVLFPSSLFHKTIPFTADEERCVIAFDIVPTS